MGCCHPGGYERVGEEGTVSERAFLCAVDGELLASFPNGGIAEIEKRIADLSYGDDANAIARERARLREAFMTRHNAEMEPVAKAYHNAYVCCCALLGVDAIKDSPLGEQQLTVVRDSLKAVESGYFVHYGKAYDDTYVFWFNIGSRPAEERMAIYRLVATHIVSTYERAAAVS